MNKPTDLNELLENLSLVAKENVQSLWSGYGQIIRCKHVTNNKTYIVKLITPNKTTAHPRGWDTSTSHQRKLISYQVEANFYQHYAHLTDINCKVPTLITTTISDEFTLLVMEDLDLSGYSKRIKTADWQSLSIAIKWLAYFHAKFMNYSADKLWPIGSYWHLGTRQDEWSTMPNSELKHKAMAIDNALNNAKYKTLVHGDAKFENLCFHQDVELNINKVAAVDFQYIGSGSGVRDIAYLAGSCLDNDGLVKYDTLLLDTYLEYLKDALIEYNITLNFDALATETRKLYPVAWADFYRFLLGWNPQSWKICDYMKQQSKVGLAAVKYD